MNKDKMTTSIVAGSRTGVSAEAYNERTHCLKNTDAETRQFMAIQNAANITRTLASNRLIFEVSYSTADIQFRVTRHTANELRNLLAGFVESEFAFIRDVNIGDSATLRYGKIVLTW